ncbi:S8 family serine peptidase [uncultured Dokdonia sp.]|uniref:S8 family serine peptidase n=1 Tax=uncultured Dokdonia sp. TaxID=575653 RepID=UPI00262E0010|nr:S8 family serine peptidase [uncultured Dokdonia sp.]
MKTNYLRGLSLGLALCATQMYAQTPDQISQITKENNQERLAQLEQQFLQVSTQQRQFAKQQAAQRGIPTQLKLENGGTTELQRILPDGTPIYYSTFNADAAISTRTTHINAGGSLGLNLMGQNMTAYVWDGGHARASHQEYDGAGGTDRYTVQDIASEGLQLNYHSAHVTGTVMASGVNANAKGMAPYAQVSGYRWNDDVAEATAAASNGMLISNHSYGLLGTNIPDQWFGSYSSESQSWDQIMYNAPFYLMVAAAGNEGNINTYNGAPLEGNAAYDKLTGKAITKNNLVVANAQDASIAADGSLISVNINSGSSEGPTDDFRIKPDIAGNGTAVYSTYQNSDTAYNSITGTSMAAPNVMGSLLLIQQHYNDVNGAFAKAATLKGLALHTADDAGAIGPDAIFGWGLLNAKRMAETVTANGTTTIIDERTLTDGGSYQIQTTVPAGKILQASISWTDAPGTPVTGTNDPTPVLINDLDIRVTQNTDTFLPWRLTGVDSNAKQDNVVDPYERIDVEDADGTYTITVTHKGSLFSGSQNYTLIVTTIDTPVIPENDCTAQVTAFPYTQGFNNTIGQWSQETNDDFNWTVRTGGTPSNGTGPTGAAEGSHYIYMETSNPNSPAKVAILNSPCLDFTGMTEAQATFKYQMTGSAVGTIRLEASTNSGITWTEVWSKSGNQGANWLDAIVNLDAYVGGTVTLRFNGTSGSSWQGDIAIDDLKISEGTFIDTVAPSTPVNVSASNIGETSLNLTWNASTDNVGVTEYEVYLDGVLYNTTTTNSTNVSGLTVETTYAFSVSAKDAAGNVSAISTPVNATTLAAGSNQIPPTGYCSSNGNNTNDEYIQRVQIGSIDNSTGASAGGYGDFTNLSTVLIANNTITITPLWTGTVYNEGYAVFVDWNRDGDFGDAGETVYTRSITTATPITGTFNVPSGAALGATRMRVSMKYNGIPTACESFQYGEVEDYIVNIDASSSAFSDGTNTSNAFDISSNTTFEFSVYPNPVTRGQLSIQVVGADVENYTIYNMLGQVVNKGAFSNTLDISRLKAGMYIIEIATGGETQAKRFIKK